MKLKGTNPPSKQSSTPALAKAFEKENLFEEEKETKIELQLKELT
jgi:hypothetical protein